MHAIQAKLARALKRGTGGDLGEDDDMTRDIAAAGLLSPEVQANLGRAFKRPGGISDLSDSDRRLLQSAGFFEPETQVD